MLFFFFNQSIHYDLYCGLAVTEKAVWLASTSFFEDRNKNAQHPQSFWPWHVWLRIKAYAKGCKIHISSDTRFPLATVGPSLTSSLARKKTKNNLSLKHYAENLRQFHSLRINKAKCSIICLSYESVFKYFSIQEMS